MSHIYYIAGPDGCGKTTHIYALKKHLSLKGVDTKYIWLRSPKLISKLLMIYCRLVGLTHYEKIKGIRIGKHEFYKSKLISAIFPWLQYLDMMIFNFFKIKLPALIKKNTLLLDRYAIDTLADLMVDTRRYNLHKTIVGKKIMKFLPPKSKIIILDVDEDTLRKRKRDVSVDPLLQEKIRVFRKIAKDMKIRIVDNNRPFNIVSKEIYNFLNSR